jgi:hypothetical protein
LLADLAVGQNHVRRLTSAYDARKVDFAFQPLKVVLAHVAAGIDTYLGLLASDDAETRAAAPLVLAFLSEHAERSIGPVRARAELASESDERARASAVLCLGYLGRYLHSEETRVRLAAIHEGSPGLVRIAAALGLLQVGPAKVGASPRQTLMDALTTYTAPVEGFPWCRGEVGHFASLALACIAVETRDPALLFGILDVTEAMPTQGAVASAVVDAAFEGEGRARGEPRSPASLSPLQRAALETLVGRKRGAQVVDALTAHGIPSEYSAFLRYLGKAPGGPLDREAGGVPLWILGLRAIADEPGACERWVAAVTEGRDEEDVLATCTDALFPSVYNLAFFMLPEGARDVRATFRQRSRAAVRIVAAAISQGISSERLDRVGTELQTSANRPVDPAPDDVCTVAVLAAVAQAASRGGVLGADWDPVLAHAACDDLAPELRSVIASLPQARREAVVGAVRFTQGLEDGPWDPAQPGPTPVMHVSGGWVLADLAPTDEVAKRAIAALQGIDDDEAPFMLERAKEAFAGMGEAGKRALAAAVRNPNQPRRELLKTILRALD